MVQKEISQLSVEDIKSNIEQYSQQLSKIKLTHSVSPIENPMQIRAMRKLVARLNTELVKREAQA